MVWRRSCLAPLNGRGIAPPSSRYLVSDRRIHTTKADCDTLVASESSPASLSDSGAQSSPSTVKAPALSCLPLSQVLRTYLITSVSSSPALLQACSSTLISTVNSNSPLTSVEKNPLLKLILRETFYKQFCAGTTRLEVQQTIKQMQSIGYSGIILEYALEVLKDAKDSDPAKDVEIWRHGLLQTVDMANSGDFVGLKWSGLGAKALQLLKQQQPPTRLMVDAMREVCTAAAAKNISLLPAAEETTTTPTIDVWSLELQKDYNRGGSAVIYNTYQAYLKSTPAQLARHLVLARSNDFTLGVKLVRGAYLSSEQRHLIWPTIQDTHAVYDSLAGALLKKEYRGLLHPLHGRDCNKFPDVNLVLATHNAASTHKAQAIRTKQIIDEEDLVPLAYAQLQGMADEVSCELVQAGKVKGEGGQKADVPRAFKCTTWGSTEECLNYLLRRAAENKDAASRTAESRVAMGAELKRRFKAVFGMASAIF